MTELNAIKDQLEALIDKMGVDSVLSLIETICDEKAEHIEANWQDKTTARAWSRVARTVERSARMANATVG
jgi:hypothetical protein